MRSCGGSVPRSAARRGAAEPRHCPARYGAKKPRWGQRNAGPYPRARAAGVEGPLCPWGSDVRRADTRLQGQSRRGFSDFSPKLQKQPQFLVCAALSSAPLLRVLDGRRIRPGGPSGSLPLCSVPARSARCWGWGGAGWDWAQARCFCTPGPRGRAEGMDAFPSPPSVRARCGVCVRECASPPP